MSRISSYTRREPRRATRHQALVQGYTRYLFKKTNILFKIMLLEPVVPSIIASGVAPMNGEYSIANGVAPPFRGESFEIYSPVIESRYGDVHWKPLLSPLPSAIVKRFAGRTMAVTGYEVDVVRKGKGLSGDDERVPCYEQYNHHYTGFMAGSKGFLHTPIGAERGADDVSMHGMPRPVWKPSAGCDLSGTWLNPSNGISVKIWRADATDATRFNASCIGNEGWRSAVITVNASTSSAAPHGSATLHVLSSGEAAWSVIGTSTAPGGGASGKAAPACSLLNWVDTVGTGTNVWCLEPYCANSPSPAPSPGPSPSPGSAGIPHAQAFSEGNGNEHRRSYKGYAKGFAQLIHSPVSFTNNAMMINTNKRLVPKSVDPSPGVISTLLPRGSLSPPDATYAGIMECPCTDRKPKVLDGYAVSTSGPHCVKEAVIATAKECASAAKALGVVDAGGASLKNATVVDDANAAPGCSLAAGGVAATGGSTPWTLLFNTAPTGSTAACGDAAAGSSAKTRVVNGGGSTPLVTLAVKLDAAAQLATIAITSTNASLGEWFAVGFNASAMAELPYAIIIDGVAAAGDAPHVHERTLGVHAAGVVLASSVTLRSHSYDAKTATRTVVLTRPLVGASAAHMSFDATEAVTFPFIAAVGSSPQLAYHRSRASGVATMSVAGGAGVCLCRDPTSNSGTIAGLNFNAKVCAAFPKSELLTKNNSICSISKYGGGLVRSSSSLSLSLSLPLLHVFLNQSLAHLSLSASLLASLLPPPHSTAAVTRPSCSTSTKCSRLQWTRFN